MELDEPYLIVVNGPNLNRLGQRSPELYGVTTLQQVITNIEAVANPFGVTVRAFQSNHEGELIDFLQEFAADSVGIIINPGALAHYGIALRDCLEDMAKPTIEVHISNVHKRDLFRQQLVLAAVVVGQVVGLGVQGYTLAASYLLSSMMESTVESVQLLKSVVVCGDDDI